MVEFAFNLLKWSAIVWGEGGEGGMQSLEDKLHLLMATNDLWMLILFCLYETPSVPVLSRLKGL